MKTQEYLASSERLYIRKINSSDIHKVFEGLSHPDVIKYYGVSFHTLEATKEQMDWFADLEENKKGLWFAVCTQSEDVFVGAGGFNDWNHEFKKAEIGFWLLPEHWGKGYMTEAMPLICQFGFEQLELHRIEGYVESENANCKNALKKLNFTFEGTQRESEVKDGKFINVDFYSKLKTD